MNALRPLILVLGLTCGFTASAGPAANALGQCLSESTTGKERKELARWMFVAMSTHPEIKQLSSATPADLEQASKTTGILFTKLLTESCAAQTRAAIQTEGPKSLETAFSTLGQVAMQELMSDGGVNAAIGAFERHMDMKKIEAMIGGQ